MAASSAAYESESAVESLDYFPYGGQRIDTKTNYGGVRNKYAGTVYDALSGLNYMQARYQNPSRGQFIAEDPAFLGDPSQQNLKDPQSLNSYSYANDNPITKNDPTGKCAEDGCFVELASIGALSGFAAGVVGQGVSDLRSGHLSSIGNYAASGVKGGAIGFSTVAAAYLGAGALLVGATAAATDATLNVAQNVFTGQPTDWADVGTEAGITGLTGGLLEGFAPKVPGRIPNLFSKSFFTGSHMTNSLSQNLIDLGAHSIIPAAASGYSLFSSYVVQNNATYLRTSGGGLQQTSLPATVSQSGTTYYRNSSGLLSSTPGH
jgi:RHS repeat-associated protein